MTGGGGACLKGLLGGIQGKKLGNTGLGRDQQMFSA